MNITYFDINETSHLVDEYYHISYSDKILPFNTMMIPYGVSGFTFIYNNGQKTALDTKETVLKGLMLNGQFFKPYQFIVNEVGFSCGINFKPTALYKLSNLDISKFTNKNLPFNQIDENLSNKFEVVFKNHQNDFKKLFQEIDNLILKLPLIENKNTNAIDQVVHFIHLKEGLLSVAELLEIIPFGQKTLETQFKKMVGLTPSKYIRIHRFLNLMRQYENNKIDLKDLIFMYDYYDESHFIKDFKLFTNKSPKVFFNIDYSIIKNGLKNI